MCHYSSPAVDWQNAAAISVPVGPYWERIVQLRQQFCRGHRFSSDAAGYQYNYYYRLLRQMAAQKKYNYIHKIQKYIHKTEYKNRLQAKIRVY